MLLLSINLKHMNFIYFIKSTRREFSFKIYPENVIVVIQYNILKIFISHFNKINQTYFTLYCSFINE